MKNKQLFLLLLITIPLTMAHAETCRILAEEAQTLLHSKHASNAPPNPDMYTAESLIKEGTQLCEEGADDNAGLKFQEAIAILNGI